MIIVESQLHVNLADLRKWEAESERSSGRTFVGMLGLPCPVNGHLVVGGQEPSGDIII